MGVQKGELRQAEPIFQKVADLGMADGWVNLARIYLREGRIVDSRKALERASNHPNKPAAPWVVAWLSGQIDERNGYLDEAIERYESVLATKIPDRKFDFSQDYEVINFLGKVTYARARREPLKSPARLEFMLKSVATYRRTIAIDSENVEAHYGLGLAYAELASGEEIRPEVAPSSTPATAGSIRSTTAEVVAPGSTGEARADAAGRLARAVVGVRRRDLARHSPLASTRSTRWSNPGLGVRRRSRPEGRAAMARALAATHKALHSMFKPDETAAGRAAAIARKRTTPRPTRMPNPS